MHRISKLIIYLLCISSYLSYGHGFGADTLIQLDNGQQIPIRTVCLHALRNKVSVSSYDMHKSCCINQSVVTVMQSTTNCSIQLGFDSQLNYANDIICTPTQEFYVPVLAKWIPAYKLNPGDCLLTKDMTTKKVMHKKFIPKNLKIYMLEVQKSHTFFVGKYSVLTHNIFLPLAANLGFVVPFGSVAMGAAGSFFGPVGLVGGIVFGGIIGVAIKAIHKNKIPKYDALNFNITFINNSCHDVSFQNPTATSPGCLIIQDSIDASCYYPIENPLTETPTGCIEIEVNVLSDQVVSGCYETREQEGISDNRCFQQIEESEQLSFYSQNEIDESDKSNVRNQIPTARNWKEFEENCPMGQLHGKKFVHTGKQNPKDGSPIRRLGEDISNTEMFKEDYYYALDRFHDGDHFEVWDKRGNWIGVANLDGTKNEKKSNAVKDKVIRSIKNIL